MRGDAVLLDEPAAQEAADGPWLVRYRALVQMMYALRRQCRRVELLGVSSVQPRHPVPSEQLALMALLAEDRHPPSGLGWWVRLAWRWGRCLVFALRDGAQLAWMQWRCRGALHRIGRRPVDVLIKTWGFAPERPEGTVDFYCGPLPGLLRARGFETLTLSGNGNGHLRTAFARGVLSRGQGRAVPEPLLLPWWAPLVRALQLLPLALEVRRAARRAPEEAFRAFCASVSLDCVSPYAMRNSLYADLLRRAVSRWRPRVVLTLWEGQPWEALAWHGTKTADPDCVVAGYQHTVLMPHALSLLEPARGSWAPAAPEVLLCLGPRTQELLAPGQAGRGTRSIVFGSFRHPAGPPLEPPRPGRRTVIVLPEAILPEAILLFNFALRLAPRLPDHQFIFRCHPGLPFADVERHLDPSRPGNVEVSRHPIGEDFSRASAVLYRGSSSVLYAALQGLKLLYLRDARWHDVDPLFELTQWREVVETPEQAAAALQNYAQCSEETAAAPWRMAAAYVGRYTAQVSDERVAQFISAAGLAGAGPSAQERAG
jgi:hypothetical protein